MDHSRGLNHLLKVNPGVKIYAPQENFGVSGAWCDLEKMRQPGMAALNNSTPKIMIEVEKLW